VKVKECVEKAKGKRRGGEYRREKDKKVMVELVGHRIVVI